MGEIRVNKAHTLKGKEYKVGDRIPGEVWASLPYRKRKTLENVNFVEEQAVHVTPRKRRSSKRT